MGIWDRRLWPVKRAASAGVELEQAADWDAAETAEGNGPFVVPGLGAFVRDVSHGGILVPLEVHPDYSGWERVTFVHAAHHNVALPDGWGSEGSVESDGASFSIDDSNAFQFDATSVFEAGRNYCLLGAARGSAIVPSPDNAPHIKLVFDDLTYAVAARLLFRSVNSGVGLYSSPPGESGLEILNWDPLGAFAWTFRLGGPQYTGMILRQLSGDGEGVQGVGGYDAYENFTGSNMIEVRVVDNLYPLTFDYLALYREP